MFKILIAIYLSILAVRYWLLLLNLGYVKKYGQTVPPEFTGVINPEDLKKISAYTFETSIINIIESLTGNIVIALFFFGGLLGVYDRWVSAITSSFLGGGILFFLILLAGETVLDIPFSLYKNFRIENRFGFNTMTMRLWFSDLLKSLAVSTILSVVAVAAVLELILFSPSWWWLWVWIFFLLFGIFVMYIAPYVIEPLFFKFEPIKAEGLENKVRSLMDRAGLKVSRVFQVDASRRSRHSNAYFTGIGRVKRIVLFDTLVEQMTQDEILGVLAHEAGHWKKRHVLKSIVLSEAVAFVGLFAAFHLISRFELPELVNLASVSFYARAAIVGFLGSLAMFPFTPLFSYLSRRNENEADRFASQLTGQSGALASALVKLSRENLSNLHPHPWYAAFYYSHPPVVERIRRLRSDSAPRENEDNS